MTQALAPEAQYPVQLRQAVSSLRYLLETAKLDHSNVRPWLYHQSINFYDPHDAEKLTLRSYWAATPPAATSSSL